MKFFFPLFLAITSTLILVSTSFIQAAPTTTKRHKKTNPFAGASNKLYTPKPGTIERKTIVDAVRRPVEKELQQLVIFHGVDIRVKNEWAFFSGTPLDQKGKSPKIFHPTLDYITQALLKKQGGKWKVLFQATATDSSIVEARRRYPQTPRSIFPSMPGIFSGDGSAERGDGFNNKD